MTQICVSKLTIIGSNNGLSPGRRQAIIWTNAGILLIGALGTNHSEIEILIKIHTFSLKKMHLKMSSGKRRPSCLSLNVLRTCPTPASSQQQEGRILSRPAGVDFVKTVPASLWSWIATNIDLARNGNSGCANKILGCAKCHFWRKSPWKWKNWGNFKVCN